MIKKLVVKNFIGLPDGEYDFGVVNRITGRNGSGKTSLAKAMMFGATGLDLTLSSAGNAYVKDPALMSQVDLYIGDGNILSTKRGKASRSVTLNKMPTNDETLARQLSIPLVALGCMFLPESFFHLPVQKRRDLFMQITPEQDLKAIFASMTEDVNPDIVDWNLSPKKLQENWTKMRIDIEKDLAKVTGQYEEMQRNESKEVFIDVAEKQQAIAKLQQEINEITAQQNELIQQAQAYNKYLYEVDLWKANQKQIEETKEENKRREIKKAFFVDLSKYEPAKQSIMQEAATAQSNLKVIKDRGGVLNNKLLEAQKIPDNCPTCGRAWDCEKPNTSEIETEIKTLRDEYTYQQEIAKEVNQRYQKLSDEIKTVQASNIALGNITILLINDSTPEPKCVACPDEKTIAENKEKIAILMQKQAELMYMLTQAETVNKKISTQKDRALALQKDIALITINLTNTSAIEKALHPKTGVFAEALKRKLAIVKIEGFKFEFTETLQNGDEKEAFRVVREKDGVQCENLSSGEKIKFCLALSQLIATLTKTTFKSVFLEHTDLMDSVPNLAGFQIFAERVSKDGLAIEIKK